MRRTLLCVLTIATAGATQAAAQSGSKPRARAHAPRVEISANVGALTAASRFTESESFTVNVETETMSAAHGVKTPIVFDVAGAVKIVPTLWVGVAYAMTNSKASAAVTAHVPHPLLFNTPRTVEGTLGGVAHDEHNVHVDLMYVLAVHAVDVSVMAGPTFFTVKQDFVAGVTVNETYPFDTATFANATTSHASKSAAGFNAGVDVSRAVSPRVAVGALIRYCRGDVKFDRQKVQAGGLEAGGGVRVRF